MRKAFGKLLRISMVCALVMSSALATLGAHGESASSSEGEGHCPRVITPYECGEQGRLSFFNNAPAW